MDSRLRGVQFEDLLVDGDSGIEVGYRFDPTDEERVEFTVYASEDLVLRFVLGAPTVRELGRGLASLTDGKKSEEESHG